MLLCDFKPVSRLDVPQTIVTKPKFPAFDFHMHFGSLLLGEDYANKYDTDEVVAFLRDKGIVGCVNLDGFWGEQLDRMLDKIGKHTDYVHTFGAVDLTRFEEPDFEQTVYRTIRDNKRKGMKGMKYWKVLGLSIRDSKGAYLRPDDPRLIPIWQCAAEEHLPILIHLADPRAFFDPIDNRNERYEELGAHPDWSFSDEQLYRFEALLEMQEHMIASNPKTTFVVAHVGSYAENLRAVSRWLDTYPNMYVDIAARVSELGRQPYTSQAFLEAYADRILFGTDSTPTYRRNYPVYYRFLETMDEYFPYEADVEVPPQGRWHIYGVGLTDDTLQKIYFANAQKLLAR